MRLAVDVLQDILEDLKLQRSAGVFRPGRPSRLYRLMPKAELAPRLAVLPCGQPGTRRPLSVAVRSITASGVVFVDSNYWMDGEKFLLQVPRATGHGARALLCSVTHWQPIASDLFVVSAGFLRQVETNYDIVTPVRAKRRSAEG